jgi:peroxiredoxin
MQACAMCVLILISMNGQTQQPPTPSTPPAGQSRAEEYRELLAMFQSAVHEVLESHKQDDATRQLYQDATNSAKIARFMKLVPQQTVDPEAVDALVWISKFSPWPHTEPQTGEGDEARSILVRDYILSPRIAIALPGVLETASASETAERLYREALARSPHREVRGRACFWLARFLKGQADWIRILKSAAANTQRVPGAQNARARARKRWGEDALKRLEQKSPELALREAEALFERAAAEFADVSAYGYADDLGLIGDAAREELRSIREFAVGRVAREITGVDKDGEHFKLSDYRGRVVVLTFSGNWCGPCRAMYPQERKMVDRLRDKAFVLLSVNTDQEKTTLQKATTAGEITWRCWQDGSTTGPITTKWLVKEFPTTFVLDHKGVIRYKDARDQALDEAVDKLLEEVKASQGGK